METSPLCSHHFGGHLLFDNAVTHKLVSLLHSGYIVQTMYQTEIEWDKRTFFLWYFTDLLNEVGGCGMLCLYPVTYN